MKTKERFRLMRYESYHSGRSLMLMGHFFTGGILLGYTVETILKAGLLEVLSKEKIEKQMENKKGTLFSHDVAQILNECRKNGIFKEIKVSKDFLEFINNNYQRYPSQQEKVFKKMSEKKITIARSISHTYYYDSLIVQLDNCLFDFTSDHSVSVLYFAYRTLETRYAQDLLRQNAFALELFSKFAEIVKKHTVSLRSDLKQNIIQDLSKGPIYYWGRKSAAKSIIFEISRISKQYKASKYRFQKWSRDS